MKLKTAQYDEEKWQLMPKVATPAMLRAAGFVASAEGSSTTGQENYAAWLASAWLAEAPQFEDDEQPKTFGCHHAAETCEACEGMVQRWKEKKLETTPISSVNDQPEFDQLTSAYTKALIEGKVSRAGEIFAELINFLDDWQADASARARREGFKICADRLKACSDTVTKLEEEAKPTPLVEQSDYLKDAQRWQHVLAAMMDPDSREAEALRVIADRGAVSGKRATKAQVTDVIDRAIALLDTPEPWV